jgi:hypothetical protein
MSFAIDESTVTADDSQLGAQARKAGNSFHRGAGPFIVVPASAERLFDIPMGALANAEQQYTTYV